MNRKELLKAIGKLNLAENEAKCYLALFSKESLTASETSKLSGVPRQNTYKALEKLMMKGLISSIHNQVNRYATLDPHILEEKALTEFKDSVENDLRELEKKKKEVLGREFEVDTNMSTVIKELDVLYKKNRNNNSPLNYIEISQDFPKIYKKLNKIMAKAKHDVVFIEKPKAVRLQPTKELKDELDEAMKDTTELIKKGVEFRGIYELSPGGERRDWQLSWLETYAKAGEKIRIIDDAPMRLVVLDTEVVYFALEDPTLGGPSSTSLLVYHKGLARSLKASFEASWVQAEEYDVFLKKERLKKKG